MQGVWFLIILIMWYDANVLQKGLHLWRFSNKNFFKVRWSLTPTLISAVHSKDWPVPYTEAGLQNLLDHCDPCPALLVSLLTAEHGPQSHRIHHWVYSHQVCNTIYQKWDQGVRQLTSHTVLIKNAGNRRIIGNVWKRHSWIIKNNYICNRVHNSLWKMLLVL